METREGYKKTKIGWIPEDWDVKPLGSLGEFLKGKGIAKKELTEDGISCVRYGEIYTVHHWILKKFYSFISTETASQSTKIFQNDILFAGSGETVEEIGKAVAYLDDHEAYAGGDTIILRPDNTNSAFLSASLDTKASNKQKRKLGQGNSVVHIYPAGLKKLLVPLPPLPEQQKIADILSTVDDKISSIENQIQQTKQLKKGLMAKLLTEGIGHTEFKDTKIGRIPKSWGVDKIGNLFRLCSGKTPLRKKEEYFNRGTIPWVKTMDLNGAYIKKTQEQITHFALKECAMVLLPSKTVLIAMYGGFKQIGRTGILTFQATTNQAMTALLPNENISPEYINYYFINFRDKWKNVATSSRKDPNITKNDIDTFYISVPPLPEQKQIASILSTVDDKLDALHNKKSSYSTLKKGLMAKLLTGQMRVKVSASTIDETSKN